MSAHAVASRYETTPLAVICGGGVLPFVVADAAIGQHRPVVMFPLAGFADRDRVARYHHHWLRLGQFGRFCRIARAEGCRDVVMIGGLMRPRLSSLVPDWGTIRIMPRIVGAFRGGDNHLLTALARILEEHDFRLVGAHEIAPEMLLPAGAAGSHQPTAAQQADIEFGLRFIEAAGPFDVGQSVVVIAGHIVAVEAAEGTDGMLARISDLRHAKRISAPIGSGVLVKAPKPQQDRRLDLPAIGPRTIEGVVAAGLAGVAAVAGQTLIADPQQTAIAADRARVFVVGVGRQGNPA